MNLSAHFTLDEFTLSQTALRNGLDNHPKAGELANLERLCETLLEPARDLLGVPLRINSGFRCPALNMAVGGARGSAHMDGRAADLVPDGMALREAFDRLRASDLPFDQIIMECNAWLHLAIARVGVEPRRQALTATGGPGAWRYEEVHHA